MPFVGELVAEPCPLDRRANEPDRSEVAASKGRVAQREVLGVVMGEDQHVRAARHGAEHELWYSGVLNVHPRDGAIEAAQPLRLELRTRESTQ